METYWKIVYGVWLGFCLLYFVMYLGVAHQPHFFEGLFGSIALAIMPYLCFLCIFKIPVDFAVWCDKNNHNPGCKGKYGGKTDSCRPISVIDAHSFIQTIL